MTADYEPHPLHAAAVEAAQEVGIPFNDDHNGPTQDGVGYCQLTVEDNVRQSQTVAFLRPVLDAPNLTVLTGTRARRLLLEGGRCVGVDIGGREVRADQEVVLCAGAIESPKLLMLSGIGPVGELARAGIDAAVDLPGVGENLHDHLLSPVICSSSRPMPPVVPGTTPLHAHLFCAQQSRPARARYAAARLPRAGVPARDGGAAGRLHADGGDDPPAEPWASDAGAPPIRTTRR